MNRAPAFQLYAADLLADERFVLMPLEARGALITLVCYAWREGSIPSRIELLSRLCAVNDEKMTTLWVYLSPCFVKCSFDEHRLVYPQHEDQRRKNEEWRAKSIAGGKKGAKSRWQNKNRSIGVVKPPLEGWPQNGNNQNMTLHSSSSSSSSERGATLSEAEEEAVHKILRSFYGAWKNHYSRDYPIGRRDREEAAAIAKNMNGGLDGPSGIESVVDRYFKHSDPFFEENKHGLRHLVGQLEKFIVPNKPPKPTFTGGARSFPS